MWACGPWGLYQKQKKSFDFDVYEDNAQYRDELDFNVEDVRRWDAQYSLLIEEIEMMIKGFETNFTKEYVIEDIVNNSMLEKKEELTKEGIKKSLVEEISFEKEITDDQRRLLLVIAGKCPVAKMIKGETEITSSIH